MDSQQLQFGTIYYAINPDSFLYGINSLRSNYSEVNMLSEYIQGGRRSKSVPDFTIIPTRWDNVPEKYQKHEAVIFAKRFNIGNIDNEAYVIFLLPHDWSFMPSGEFVNYIDRFFLAVSDVTNTDSGDLIITPQPHILYDSKEETDYGEVSVQHNLEVPVPSFMPESTETKKRPKKLTRWLKKRIPDGHLEEDVQASEPEAHLDLLTLNEQKELSDIDSEQQRALDNLKQAVLNYVLTYHTDPSKIIQEHISGKFIIAPRQNQSHCCQQRHRHRAAPLRRTQGENARPAQGHLHSLPQPSHRWHSAQGLRPLPRRTHEHLLGGEAWARRKTGKEHHRQPLQPAQQHPERIHLQNQQVFQDSHQKARHCRELLHQGQERSSLQGQHLTRVAHTPLMGILIHTQNSTISLFSQNSQDSQKNHLSKKLLGVSHTDAFFVSLHFTRNSSAL